MWGRNDHNRFLLRGCESPSLIGNSCSFQKLSHLSEGVATEFYMYWWDNIIMYFVLSTLFLGDKNYKSPKKNEPFLLFSGRALWILNVLKKCSGSTLKTRANIGTIYLKWGLSAPWAEGMGSIGGWVSGGQVLPWQLSSCAVEREWAWRPSWE